jgi:hypothetical protein
MADERPTWKSLASSRLSSFKGYLAQHDIQQSLQISNTSDQAPSQSWKQWGKKIGKYRGNGANVGTDQIALFPGWAARRYRQAAGNAGGMPITAE